LTTLKKRRLRRGLQFRNEIQFKVYLVHYVEGD